MRYDEMVDALQRRLTDGADNPGTVLTATVQALSEQAWDEAADLRAQLPGQLADVEPAGPGARRTLDQFVTRIGELTGAPDGERAREYTQAGFGTISAAITEGQLRQLLETLPEEYGSLAPSVSGLTGNTERLLAEVQRQAELRTQEEARAATEAVLAVVAEASTGGQAEDLGQALPPDIREFLRADEPAQHRDADGILDEIARRSPVTKPQTVRLHTSAVLTVLNQWAPAELTDTVNHLPRPIALLAT